MWPTGTGKDVQCHLLLEKCTWKLQWSHHLMLVRILKKSANNKCWRGHGERESTYTVGTATMFQNQYGDYLRKLKIELPQDPAIPLQGIYLEMIKTPIWKDNMHPSVHSGTVHNSQTRKQPTHPSTGGWINKAWHIYKYIYTRAMEYDSAIKRTN